MKTATRMIAIVMVAAVVGLAAHRHALRLRMGYGIRSLLEERAHLDNEVAWLQGEVAKRSRTDGLLLRARMLGIDAGSPEGRVLRESRGETRYPGRE
jgi:hypothetical protein